MLKALIGYMIGSMSGVALMCMLQINRVNGWKEVDDYESRDHDADCQPKRPPVPYLAASL